MKSKRDLLKKSRLYLILDKKALKGKPVSAVINRIKNADFDVVQLRDKESKMQDTLKDAILIKNALANTSKLFIVNDYPQIARILDCDGVHLGQSDPKIKDVRKFLGRNKLIGISCHSLKQAREAEENGADYIGIGPVFKTPTKPKAKPVGLRLVREGAGSVSIPFFAIGNVKRNNIKELLAAGAKRVAVCRAILQADEPALAAKSIREALG